MSIGLASSSAEVESLEDLCRESVRIGIAIEGCLKGVWEDIASKAGLADQVRRNITHHANGCGSVMSLINERKVDAIFGWNAFQFLWPNTGQVIELSPDLQVLRSTGAGVVSYTKDQALSQKLIDFLTSDGGRSIFSEYGWIQK